MKPNCLFKKNLTIVVQCEPGKVFAPLITSHKSIKELCKEYLVFREAKYPDGKIIIRHVKQYQGGIFNVDYTCDFPSGVGYHDWARIKIISYEEFAKP